MNLAWFIGRRYSQGSAGNRYRSVINRVSFAGMALGVMALTIVVSVMNGFDRELKHRILGVVPHLVVTTGTPGELRDRLLADPDVIGVAPYLQRAGVVMQSGAGRLVQIQGIVPGLESTVSVLPDHLVEGSLDELSSGAFTVALGRPLAWQLGVSTGDSLTVVLPEASEGGRAITPRVASFTVKATFELDSELDYSLLVTHHDDLAAIARVPAASLRVTLDDLFLADSVAATLRRDPDVISVTSWTDTYGNFFETVRMEKTMMFILLTLVVAIAAFNIVSGLAMAVRDKQGDIAVFRTMGLSPASVMYVFVIQGFIIGLAGTLAGLVAGVPLAASVPEIVGFFEELLGARMLAGTYFDEVPSEIRWPDVALIAVVASIISLLATLYPAWRASRVLPADVLRYE